MRKIAVGDLMTRNFAHVSPQANLHDCAKAMTKYRVNSLLITEGRKLVGILTSRDILKLITKKPQINLKELKVMEIATKKVAVIKPSSDIEQAIRKMRALNFRRLPVLSKGEVIGVVTVKDILRIEPTLYAELGELTDIKEEERKLTETGLEWESEGICENCGVFSDLLKVEGQLLCPDCRNDLF